MLERGTGPIHSLDKVRLVTLLEIKIAQKNKLEWECEHEKYLIDSN